MWYIKMPQQNNKNKWNFNVLFNPINLKYQFKIITNKNYYHGIFHSLVHANLGSGMQLTCLWQLHALVTCGITIHISHARTAEHWRAQLYLPSLLGGVSVAMLKH